VIAGCEFGSATAQLLIPLIIWATGQVVHDCFCANKATSITPIKPTTKIKGHFDGCLFIYIYYTPFDG
jgi:hypothetical protein